MKTTAAVIAIAALILVTTSPVYAQGPEWETLAKGKPRSFTVRANMSAPWS